MIKDPSGAEVTWDWQRGTFMAVKDGVTYGLRGEQYTSISALETDLGITLSIAIKEHLLESRSLYPFVKPKRTVTKLQFMNLFRPADLDKIYLAALGGPEYPPLLTVRVRQALDRVDRASKDEVDLEDSDTIQGLQAMEQYNLITAGDAERIGKGISWA